MFVLGLLLEPVLIKPMFRQALERQDEYATVVTISLLLFLRNLATALAGPYQFTPGSNLPMVMVGPLPVARPRLAAFLCALAALAIFYVRAAEDLVRAGAPCRLAKPDRRADRGRRHPAGSIRSPSASAWRSRAWRARCWRRCSWSFRPTAW